MNSRTFWGETICFFDYPGHRRTTAVYNSAIEISSFYHPFNQSKYNAALKIAKLFCHWLIYLYKDELSIVWRCAGKKSDGIDFMSFSCQLSCGALSLKCWKFEKSLVCNCIPLFLWSFGFEYQSLELHLNSSRSFLFKLQFQKATFSAHPNFWRICIVLYIGDSLQTILIIIPIVFVPHCLNFSIHQLTIIIFLFLVRILLTILKNSVFICSFWQKISKWTPNSSILSILILSRILLTRKTVKVRWIIDVKKYLFFFFSEYVCWVSTGKPWWIQRWPFQVKSRQGIRGSVRNRGKWS